MLNFEKTSLPGVVVITPDVFTDKRGYFLEMWRSSHYKDAGLPSNFVQDNQSRSVYGVLRGLHFQYPQWQGKLVHVARGEIFDVAVDIRRDSPTFSKWIGVVLNDKNNKQMFIPAGFAHGFCVLSDFADVLYKCTSEYKPEEDDGIRWDDPAIAIDWPIDNPVVSEKDSNLPMLSEKSVV